MYPLNWLNIFRRNDVFRLALHETLGCLPSKKLVIRSQMSPILTVVAAMVLLSSGCHWAASGQNANGARLYQQGQYTAAMQEFQKAINTDPKNADGYYNLAATTHRLAVQRNDSGLMQEAENLYNQCLDYSP